MEWEEITFDDLYRCAKCGLCLAQCPVYNQSLIEKDAPRGKIQLAKFFKDGRLELSERSRELYSRCLLCGACGAVCPSGMKADQIVTRMRREISAKKGLDRKTARVVSSVMESHNISREDNEERTEALDDLLENTGDKGPARVVYFVGCVSSFFPMVQRIARNMVKIMEQARVPFTVLGGEEWCCGFPLVGAGVPERIEELADHNVEAVKRSGAGRVVFSCPSCLRTWKAFYRTDLELMHTTEFILELIEAGALPLKALDPMKVTYHDPCDLGRHGGIYDPPRKILEAIPGLHLVEMEHRRESSLCCGGGGNLEMVDPVLVGKLAGEKIREIQKTGADAVVTACQQCVRTMTTRAKRQRIDLPVMDITDLILKAMK